MFKAAIEEYRRYFRNIFGFEPSISKNYQIYFATFEFYSRYTQNQKTQIYYPVKPGLKIIVEIPENIANELREIASWFLKAIKNQDIHILRTALARWFNLVSRARAIYIERVIGSVAVRLRVNSVSEIKQTIEKIESIAQTLATQL